MFKKFSFRFLIENMGKMAFGSLKQRLEGIWIRFINHEKIYKLG